MEEKKKQTTFTSKFGMMMAAIGGAVGLGNLWGFPAKLGRGGGFWFLVIYVIVIFLLGIPMTLAEYGIGRSTRKGPIASYKELCSKFAWIGWFNEAVCVLCLGFILVITGWVLHYIYQFIFAIFGGDTAFWLADGAEYFGSYVSQIGLPIFWTAVAAFLTWIITAGGVVSGIEKSCRILIPALAILLVIVSIRSITLPGASEGLDYLFKPNKQNFIEAGGFGGVLAIALAQMFFSVNIGFGTNLTYGTMIQEDLDMPRAAIQVPLADMFMAILAALATIPAVFAFGYSPSAGGGMLFITLKSVFTEMQGGKLFGLVFFICVFFASISTCIGIVAAIVRVPQDHLGWSEKKSLTVSMLVAMIPAIFCSLGYSVLSDVRLLAWLGKDTDILDSVDYIAENTLATIGALGLVIFVGWVWKPESLFAECEKTGPVIWKKYFAFTIKYICPPIILLVILISLGIITL